MNCFSVIGLDHRLQIKKPVAVLFPPKHSFTRAIMELRNDAGDIINERSLNEAVYKNRIDGIWTRTRIEASGKVEQVIDFDPSMFALPNQDVESRIDMLDIINRRILYYIHLVN